MKGIDQTMVSGVDIGTRNMERGGQVFAGCPCRLWDALSPPDGFPIIVSIVGGGGKTTLMFLLAQELAQAGHKVVVTTSTKIGAKVRCPVVFLGDEMPSAANLGSAPTPVVVVKELQPPGYDNGIGQPAAKLLGLSPAQIIGLAQFFDVVLVEADGAKHLPLKVPADYEPVIIPVRSAVWDAASTSRGETPAPQNAGGDEEAGRVEAPVPWSAGGDGEAGRVEAPAPWSTGGDGGSNPGKFSASGPVPPYRSMVVAVAGMDAVGQPFGEKCFRHELAMEMLGKGPDEIITPQDMALILTDEKGSRKHVGGQAFRILLNKADTERDRETAREVAACIRSMHGVQGEGVRGEGVHIQGVHDTHAQGKGVQGEGAHSQGVHDKGVQGEGVPLVDDAGGNKGITAADTGDMSVPRAQDICTWGIVLASMQTGWWERV
ncbi:MAG: putative selenium-dependent hydroxylase accessory protein YqeC [Lachnospiraceae bacterium]|jgi:hypothetical protein|nr:putative selenium-dependent hydroxylase accessory protein YqeC [Lachnospiraceae bacterium]